MSEAQSTNATQQTANVKYGVYGQTGQYVGKTIGTVRRELGTLWGIPVDAAGYSGKERLSDDHVIAADETIEFHRRMGEKGSF